MKGAYIMPHHHLNPFQTVLRTAWFVPFLFVGLMGCQEETGTVGTPPAETGNVSATAPPPAPPVADSTMPDTSQEPGSSSEQPRSITGEVVSIEGKNFIIKDAANEEVRVEADSMTLIDEGLGVGDKAEVRYSADEKPIAIRKVRGT